MEAKGKLIMLIIFFSIGSLIGVVMLFSRGTHLVGSWIGLWLAMGIPGSILIEIFEHLSDSIKEALIYIVLKSLAGPVFPIKHIVEYAGDM